MTADIPSTSRYRERFAMHMSFSRGGYFLGYEILDGEKLVGTRSVGRETGKHPETTTYKLMGSKQEFTSAKDFIAAYKAMSEASAA